MDLASVYEQQGHCLLSRWLLLTDPADPSCSARGYLRFSATVLTAGDQAPSFKEPDSADDADIEANLLRPAGASLQQCTFFLRVYRAEELPRMDADIIQGVKKLFGAGSKDKCPVDPYLVFSFAGKKVKTKTMRSTDSPEFNQELRLGSTFPSMCENLKFTLMEWDRASADDVVATEVLPLSLISSPGNNGFLPTFGPCFVNLYGSPREFSPIANDLDKLNFGRGEGVAYRGRVLLELRTRLEPPPPHLVNDVTAEQLANTIRFIRRREYKLNACFLSASMICEAGKSIEFEISIGNFGNSMDATSTPCSSRTQPTLPVYDGEFYHFLPWVKDKPCASVQCQWEDVEHRLHSINLLEGIASRAEADLTKLEASMRRVDPPESQMELLQLTIDTLMSDLNTELPQFDPGKQQINDLDRRTRLVRQAELQQLLVDVTELKADCSDISDAKDTLQRYINHIRHLAVDPQNSVPDVFIWMLAKEERIAYYRIPANKLLYADNPSLRGEHCAKILNLPLKFPRAPDAEPDKDSRLPCLLRVRLWLGQTQHEQHWQEAGAEGTQLALYAETYENEVCIPGFHKWTSHVPSRPSWSDAAGRLRLKKDTFVPPEGWSWTSDWQISPDLSTLCQSDQLQRNFTEEVFEHESRMPGLAWQASEQRYANVNGDPEDAPEDTPLPEGWTWTDDWTVDNNRAVDEKGWEYAVEATVSSYGPVRKPYHLHRRRRLIRPRKRADAPTPEQQQEQQLTKVTQDGGWEYALHFKEKFHLRERKVDLVRRRRWLRQLVCNEPGNDGTFTVQPEDEDDPPVELAPRMFLTYKDRQRYQLRVYMYQARDLLAADDNGLSDPYARVSFEGQSCVTERLKQTTCPTWDQTLLMHELRLSEDPQQLAEAPPAVVVEIFDYDLVGAAEFMGWLHVVPHLTRGSKGEPPRLAWHQLQRAGSPAGELLAAFHLIQLDGDVEPPPLPPRNGDLYIVPPGIRPVLRRTGIEILCWGLRNMLRFQLLNVDSPSVEFEVGGELVNSEVVKRAKNPHFSRPVLLLDVMLPVEEEYMPPVNMRVRDQRGFGRNPVVGIHAIQTLSTYRCSVPEPEAEVDGADLPVELRDVHLPALTNGDHNGVHGTTNGDGPGDNLSHQALLPAMEAEVFPEASEPVATEVPTYGSLEGSPPLDGVVPANTNEQLDETKPLVADWWSKFYASCGESEKCRDYLDRGGDKLKIYDTPLEDVEGFHNFVDFCNTFHLSRGKIKDNEDAEVVGEFKGSVKVYNLPEHLKRGSAKPALFRQLPPTTSIECTIRVYVVRAFDLQPLDDSGKADPFVRVTIGDTDIDSSEDYVPNTINPVFGRMFEVKAMLPAEKDLRVRICDFDLLSADDVIGETIIDLENRFLTRHRATVGLAASYQEDGVCKWRDARKPLAILEDVLNAQGLPKPEYNEETRAITIGRRIFNATDFGLTEAMVGESEAPSAAIIGQRLALRLLQQFSLVSEHIETRPLYNPLQPDIEQGRVQMFVDIFSDPNPPPPIDISPRKAKKYELRVVVWNTRDVILDEESITGEQMSDIYVKGWLSGIEEKQETDVHYRSLDGEGNFNWRFVFPFEYIPEEGCMVVKKKEHFWSLDETEQRFPAILNMQIWDNDLFSADDFLGTIELNLDRMLKPAKRCRSCKLPDTTGPQKWSDSVSLFDTPRLRGFWPCSNSSTGTTELTGKLELELELVTAEEAEKKPVGTGRQEPNQFPKLDPPNRPAMSFLWITSPWKTCKYVIWKNYGCYIITAIIVLLLVLLVVLFIYSLPGATASKLVGS